jgi:hypothetical protein
VLDCTHRGTANAGDQEKALELVHQTERVMEAEVEETGDGAYGGGPTRRAFAEEERVLADRIELLTDRARAGRPAWFLTV